MRNVIVAIVALAGTARADGTGEVPGTAPVEPARVIPPGWTCGVHLLRAPVELARSIEDRLAGLSACDGRLDVWIVRAVDGLYVMARDELGRVRERVVPDAEVAAALIASWVEIDLATPLTGAGARPPVVIAAAIEPERRSRAVSSAAPLTDVVEDIPPVRLAGGATPLARTVGLTVFAGGTTGGMTTGGAEIDHDVWSHEGFSIAAKAVLTRDVASSYYVVRWDDDFFKETGRWGGAAMLDIHRRIGTGRCRLTPRIAFGLGVTRHEVLTAEDVGAGELATPVMINETTIGPKIAASVAFGIRVAAKIDVELAVGWTYSGYPSADHVDPSDQAIFGGIGLRHDR